MFSRQRHLSGARGTALLLVLVLIGSKAAELWVSGANEFWWLWILAVVLAQRTLGRVPTLIFSLAGAVAANAAGLWAGRPDALLRFIVMLVVFGGAPLLLGEAIEKRGEAVAALAGSRASLKTSEEQGARFRALIDSTGVGVMTVCGQGKILTANDAAHRLLGFHGEKLAGRFVTSYFPPLGGLLTLYGVGFRSAMECLAWRRDGQVFNAQVCFSTYPGPSGFELAVLFNDSTLWAPEGHAVSANDTSHPGLLSASVDMHEMYNLSFAIETLCRDLLSRPRDEQRELLESLQDLARGIRRLSGRELRPQAAGGVTRLEFGEFASEAEALLRCFFDGSGIELEWKVPEDLPPVWADREGLLEVFLNLARNSLGALVQRPAPKVVSVSATQDGGRVFVHFSDNGSCLRKPEEVFRPVVLGPDIIRVGLYISRALLRCVGGDLHYRPDKGHPCFVLELLTAELADRAQGGGTAAA